VQHEGTLSTHDKLVYMANQIAKFFANEGEEKAAAGAADHITRFWDPRMRLLIVAHFRAGGAGLDPIAKRAVEQLSRKASTG
jgi:formate dehydrogenase subunit delta